MTIKTWVTIPHYTMKMCDMLIVHYHNENLAAVQQAFMLYQNPHTRSVCSLSHGPGGTHGLRVVRVVAGFQDDTSFVLQLPPPSLKPCVPSSTHVIIKLSRFQISLTFCILQYLKYFNFSCVALILIATPRPNG